MLINNKHLLTLPVITKSGQNLGKVSQFDLDVESMNLRHIYVKTKGIKGLFADELKIHRGQIVEITDKKVIVLDNVALKETPAPAFAGTEQLSTAGSGPPV